MTRASLRVLTSCPTRHNDQTMIARPLGFLYIKAPDREVLMQFSTRRVSNLKRH